MALIYVETTIPSFYYEVRTDPDMIARRDWTRQWFDDSQRRHDLVTSVAVVEELRRGTFPGRAQALELIESLPLLSITEPVIETVEAYISHNLMPADPTGVALHLALASCHGCDFLVTWNCRHLANANKFGHIRRVNAIMNLKVPELVTPLELLTPEDDDEQA